MRQTVWVVIALVMVLGSSQRGLAEGDDETARATLKGLSGVELQVEVQGEGASGAGFNKKSFQTDAELKLRLAGIKMLTGAETAASPGNPYLYINISSLADQPGEDATFAILISLYQGVRLERDPNQFLSAATWSVLWMGGGNASDARDRVKDLLDQFLVAWLSVNPKK